MTTISNFSNQERSIRNTLLIFYCTFFSGVSVIAQTKPVQLNDGIQTATLKEAGINERFIVAMHDSIASGTYSNIHSVLILRNNKLVYEDYFAGKDQIRGADFFDVINHQRDTLHDVRSVTKSVVSVAVMMALHQGKIKSLHERVFNFFPDYAKYDTGFKKEMRIHHLLNMTSGFEWNEETGDTTNNERVMNRSKDAVAYVLSKPFVAKPGQVFNYNGGCTQVLAAILEKATGMSVDLFVEKYLFTPLGITNYQWVKNKDGNPSAASGLRMRSRDMAKFGLLLFNRGIWNDRLLIPSSLVDLFFKSQVSTCRLPLFSTV